MNKTDLVLPDVDNEKEEKYSKIKNDFKNRKSGRPLGYIFPNRIKSAMSGENPTTTVYMNTDKLTDDEVQNRKNKKMERTDILQTARVPMFCPHCNRAMSAQIDEKFFWLRGKCHVCVSEDETKMRIDGSFENYEKLIILKNKFSFYTDAKTGLMEYYKTIKPYQEFVNDDGNVEKWNDPDYEKLKEFIEKEIQSVDDILSELANEFEDMEKTLESDTIDIE